MNRSIYIFAAFAALVAAPAGAQAQTAAQINRANQALQICASPMGAAIPECAQLGGLMGGASAAGGANLAAGLLGGGVPAAGGSTGGIAGGLLGMAAQAYSATRQPAAPAYAPTPVYGAPPAGYASGSPNPSLASAQATHNAALDYSACVARVGATNQAGVQGCIAQLSAASGGARPPAYAPPPATYAAAAPAPTNLAADYQACVMRVGATNSAGIQGCIAQMNAAARGAPAAPAAGSAAAGAFSALLGAR